MEHLNFLLNPLLGGLIIGIAASLMLFMNGRIAGISGILNGFIYSFSKRAPRDYKVDRPWRFSLICGLISGGFVLFLLSPILFENQSGRSPITIALGGLLVGFGTVMAGGCTSGHGVCGISRLSIRSIVATVTFITIGILTVAIFGGNFQ